MTTVVTDFLCRLFNILPGGVRGQRGDQHDRPLWVHGDARLSDQEQRGGQSGEGASVGEVHLPLFGFLVLVSTW